MRTGSPLTDRIAEMLPDWLAGPASVASTMIGFAGAGLILLSASTGSIAAAVWAAVAFAVSAILWHVAEFAGDRS